jgi:hypothetical protein
MERCPNSVISYKLMLHLKKLKKSAILKKIAVSRDRENNIEVLYFVVCFY